MIFAEWNKQRDRFDAVVNEYLRANRKTVAYLAERAGCNTSSLWRYRNKDLGFRKMPFEVFCTCMRQANVSNDDLRRIIGLPTGTRDEN